MNSPQGEDGQTDRLPDGQPGFLEFIVLMSMLFSLIALSTDAMLPSLPRIAADLIPDDVNKAQLVISIFILGTGVGQLIAGPISDSFGRKGVIMVGALIYIVGCVAAFFADSLALLLAARFLQGLGVSAPRTVALALVRDIYSGRRMARVMSLSMMFFVLVPAAAPWIGQHIEAAFGWRHIFTVYIIFISVSVGWLWIRQPETLPIERRRALTLTSYRNALRDVLGSRIVVIYMLVLSLAFSIIFSYLVNAQQIYVDVYGKGSDFPKFFALIALLSGSAGFLNATLVMRFGMRPIVTFVYGCLFALSLVFAGIALWANLGLHIMFPLFLFWSLMVFFSAGLCIGNLNALALEPMGHVAGFASAIIGASATVLSAVFAIPVGLWFNGSILPLVLGITVFSGGAFALMLTDPKGQAGQAG